MSQVVTQVVTNNNQKFHLVELPKGKKAQQVAKIISLLQEQPEVPLDFEELCAEAGAKYPQDIQAATMALQCVEYVNQYAKSAEVGHRPKTYYAWVGPVNP